MSICRINDSVVLRQGGNVFAKITAGRAKIDTVRIIVVIFFLVIDREARNFLFSLEIQIRRLHEEVYVLRTRRRCNRYLPCFMIM